MAKKRYRIEGSNYGGETVVGRVSNSFVRHYIDSDRNDLVDIILEADDNDWENISEMEEHENPEAILSPRQNYLIWECDDFEHINGPYSDGEFFVYEVPADESDDWDWDNNEVWRGNPLSVYSREAGLCQQEEPEWSLYDSKHVTEENKGVSYSPVLTFHSSEKGTFGCWFLDTDEEFDPYKLGIGVAETMVGEFVERVYYNKTELETDYDYNDTTGKGYYADIGWLNHKWHDKYCDYFELDDETWEAFDEDSKWEKENK